MQRATMIQEGKAVIGIELGSTRIKAVLADPEGGVLATGVYDWENVFRNGIWTYDLSDIHEGLKRCYTNLRENTEKEYGVTIEKAACIGISAMMHGYMALNGAGEQIAPFQTWRNTNTQASADELTELFDFNIPLRWTVAHLYQRILDREEHVRDLDFVSTLSGYIHYRLTGERVIGIGDASGMFPIDSVAMDYDDRMVHQFDEKIKGYDYPWTLRKIFPRVEVAGRVSGHLTPEGVKLLDESGHLAPGIPFCAPEGDAGTGMVATNSVAVRTGNVSAGTSTFAMIVLEKQLQKLHREIDMVTTPSGFPVAMSHANNGTSDLNAWVGLFGEFAGLIGCEISQGELFEKLYTRSLEGDADCGGVLSYGYYSGENVTMINEGRLALLRTPDARFNIANLMKSHLYTSLCAVRIGLDILTEEEHCPIDRLTGHGGFFKTPVVGQRALAVAAKAPVTVMKTANEGGAWGIALLAAFTAVRGENETLEEFLEKIFASMEGSTLSPTKEEIDGFDVFLERYKKGLPVEAAAIEAMDW